MILIFIATVRQSCIHCIIAMNFDYIKKNLQTSKLQGTGRGGGGCINEGEVYITDAGKVFIKKNFKEKACEMFEGEFESLKAIAATKTVTVPCPLLVSKNQKDGAVLVMEYLDIQGLSRKSKLLGDNLARLHLFNIELEKDFLANDKKVGGNDQLPVSFVSQFGFHVPTCCGYIAQDNSWCNDWPTFYGKKLDYQIKLIEEKYGDREAIQLWSSLSKKLPDFFKNLQIKPSLLHGDLWSGNAGECNNVPVIFDPASFYGHHEFDLAIVAMFGGFNKAFWDAYHDVIPRREGWDCRHKLYLLFHHLNHWNHFGGGYRSGSIEIMKELIK